jgi:hypothetical protein
MTDKFFEECLLFSESLLREAREEMKKENYCDAESSTRAALDGFLLVQEDPQFIERVFNGLREIGEIVVMARKLWTERKQTPSVEFMDQIRARERRHVDELDSRMREACQKAIAECNARK